jgi:hypothetical protein
MFGFIKKKRKKRKKKLKEAYRKGIVALQLNLYEIFVSVLKDEVGRYYPIDTIKNAVAITVNKMGLRPESRPNPIDTDDKLAKSLSDLKELTMIKEAVSLILLFDYFISEKTDKKLLERAKELGGADFPVIKNMMDIEKTSVSKIHELTRSLSNRLHQIAFYDIRDNL